jgi:arylsulfatase A-like enzyme
LADTLRGSGFHTAGFHSNTQITARYGFDRGFDTYEGPIWDPDVTRESLSWLSSVQPPFFLYVHYISLHAPYQPTEFFDELYRGRTGDAEHDQYCAEITLVDQWVGRFLLGLAERGLLDRTLLWFLSDHGEEFLEHGGRYHGETLYDESIRTLSLLVYPPLIREGSSTSVVGSHVNVLPTLLSLVGLEADAPIQGQDVSALARGEAWDDSGRCVFAQSYGGAKSDPLVSIRDAVISGPWKLIAPSWRQGFELYDLVDDPAESNDLFSSKGEEAQRLLSRIDQFIKASDTIAERLGRAEALQTEPVELSEPELENLRSLGYIRSQRR